MRSRKETDVKLYPDVDALGSNLKIKAKRYIRKFIFFMN
jgi:hypothetical protein